MRHKIVIFICVVCLCCLDTLAQTSQHYEAHDASTVIQTLKIFPNPVTKTTKVKLQFSAAITAKLTLYDITGKTLVQDDIDNKSTKLLHLNHLNNGIYMLRIASDNHAVTRKIVILN